VCVVFQDLEKHAFIETLPNLLALLEVCTSYCGLMFIQTNFLPLVNSTPHNSNNSKSILCAAGSGHRVEAHPFSERPVRFPPWENSLATSRSTELNGKRVTWPWRHMKTRSLGQTFRKQFVRTDGRAYNGRVLKVTSITRGRVRAGPSYSWVHCQHV